jgi:hypothetical protein
MGPSVGPFKIMTESGSALRQILARGWICTHGSLEFEVAVADVTGCHSGCRSPVFGEGPLVDKVRYDQATGVTAKSTGGIGSGEGASGTRLFL